MDDATRTTRMYRFGAFTIDARTGELRHDGAKIPLRDQSLQLLIALVQQPGELITREELARRLWPADTFVDFDRGLNKAVNHLRDALGDSPERPSFIETLPRKGYRFIAPVTTDDDRRVDAGGSGAVASASRLRRTVATSVAAAAALALAAGVGIAVARYGANATGASTANFSALAVIPLENLSRDQEQQYFADGLTDALITDLANTGAVRVTSRTSVMQYRGTKKTVKQIGRELDVDAVVEGTVTRVGSRVRVTAQLIQTSTDMHLWANAYEREVSEILDLQRALSTDIARRINVFVKPLDHPRKVNPEAFGLYLKGRYAFYEYTAEGWQQAIDHFTRALVLDREFAPAYSGLADAYLVAGAYGAIPTDEALTRGKAAAVRALELDDTLASAHYALATAHAWYDWNRAAAEQEFRRGLELNPNDAMGRNWHGGYLSLLGRHEEAIAEHERSRQLDPRSLIANANLTRALYWARRYTDAIAQAHRTLELDPDFGVAQFWLDGALRHQGLLREAVALRQAVDPGNASLIARTFEHAGFDALLGNAAARFKRNGMLVTAARAYAQIGDQSEALALLEACAERGCSDLVTLNVEPDFDVLRSSPRFQALLRAISTPRQPPA